MTTTASRHTSVPAGVTPVRPFSELSVDEDTQAWRAGADAARQAVTESEMPTWLADAIGRPYDELADGDQDCAGAVRSSATAEDTASASFAGMNERAFSTSAGAMP